MSLFIASINSGSNGNCYYVGNGSDAVLIDAGLSCKETEKRMRQLRLPMASVRAVFISHEHGDHIKGLEGLCKKHNLPVYITARTLQHSRLLLPQHLLRNFAADEAINIGDMSVVAFGKKHDAIDAHSFIVRNEGITVGVFTDLGIVCENLIHHFKQCHAAFLEANYDALMLEKGRYPHHLKNRIRGGHGHLSNLQALGLFTAHRPAHMSHILLAHLSQDNNDPQLVEDMFLRHAEGVQVSIASRYEPTGVFHITGPGKPYVAQVKREKVMQASLF